MSNRSLKKNIVIISQTTKKKQQESNNKLTNMAICNSCLIFFKEPISSQVTFGTETKPSLFDDGTIFFSASLKSTISILI